MLKNTSSKLFAWAKPRGAQAGDARSSVAVAVKGSAASISGTLDDVKAKIDELLRKLHDTSFSPMVLRSRELQVQGLLQRAAREPEKTLEGLKRIQGYLERDVAPQTKHTGVSVSVHGPKEEVVTVPPSAPVDAPPKDEFEFELAWRNYETLYEKLRALGVFLLERDIDEHAFKRDDIVAVFADPTNISKMLTHSGITTGDTETMRLAAGFITEHQFRQSIAKASPQNREAFHKAFNVSSCTHHIDAIGKILDKVRHAQSLQGDMRDIARAHDLISSALAEFSLRVLGERDEGQPLSKQLSRAKERLVKKGGTPADLMVLGHARNDEKLLYDHLMKEGPASNEVKRACDAAPHHVEAIQKLSKTYGAFENVPAQEIIIQKEAHRSAEDIREEVELIVTKLPEERRHKEEKELERLVRVAEMSKSKDRFIELRTSLIQMRERLRAEQGLTRNTYDHSSLVQALNRIEESEVPEKEETEETADKIVEKLALPPVEPEKVEVRIPSKPDLFAEEVEKKKQVEAPTPTVERVSSKRKFITERGTEIQCGKTVDGTCVFWLPRETLRELGRPADEKTYVYSMKAKDINEALSYVEENLLNCKLQRLPASEPKKGFMSRVHHMVAGLVSFKKPKKAPPTKDEPQKKSPLSTNLQSEPQIVPVITEQKPVLEEASRPAFPVYNVPEEILVQPSEPEQETFSASTDKVTAAIEAGIIDPALLRQFVTLDGTWRTAAEVFQAAGIRNRKDRDTLTDLVSQFTENGKTYYQEGLLEQISPGGVASSGDSSGGTEMRMYRIFGNASLRDLIKEYIRTAGPRNIGMGAKPELMRMMDSLYAASQRFLALEKKY